MFQISGLRAVNCTIVLESCNLNKNNSILNVTDKNYLNNNKILWHAKIVEKLKRIYIEIVRGPKEKPRLQLIDYSESPFTVAAACHWPLKGSWKAKKSNRAPGQWPWRARTPFALSSPFSCRFFPAVASLRKLPAANRGRAKSIATPVIGGVAASWRRPSRNPVPGKTELTFVPSLFPDFPASLERASRSRFLVFTLCLYLSAVATPPPPRFLLLLRPRILARLHLGSLSSYLAPTSASLLRRLRRRYHRCCALSLSFSTFTLPSLLFCFPSWLPSSSSVSVSPEPPAHPEHPRAYHTEMVFSFLLLLPCAFVLPLATLLYGIRRPGRNPASGGGCKAVEAEERKGGFQRRRFLRY